jgi:hypothetical protein
MNLIFEPSPGAVHHQIRRDPAATLTFARRKLAKCQEEKAALEARNSAACAAAAAHEAAGSSGVQAGREIPELTHAIHRNESVACFWEFAVRGLEAIVEERAGA